MKDTKVDVCSVWDTFARYAVGRIALECAETLSARCYPSLHELLEMCAECYIHDASSGSKWIVGFLNPTILS